MDRLPTLKVLSQNEKYCKIVVIAQKLANVASHITTREYSYAVQCLEKVLKAWEQGQHVIVEVVDMNNCHDEDTNDCVGDDPCGHDVDLTINHVESNEDNPLPSFTNDNHFDIDKLSADLNTDKLPVDRNIHKLYQLVLS